MTNQLGGTLKRGGKAGCKCKFIEVAIHDFLEILKVKDLIFKADITF